MRCNPLGVLTTAIPFGDHPTIQSSHIPWVLDTPDDIGHLVAEQPQSPDTDEQLDASIRSNTGQPIGILRAHMARANPHAKALIAAAAHTHAIAAGNDVTNETKPDNLRVPDGGVTLPEEVLILFTGPVQHYVTPKFYVVTKPATGKVVPTWNYEAVQAYGQITVYPSTTSNIADSLLTNAIIDLTNQSELTMNQDGGDGKSKEWLVDDAPDPYIDLLKKSIVGISVEITRLGGKFKMSQEMGSGDREGVAEGFENIGNNAMASSVRRWGNPKT